MDTKLTIYLGKNLIKKESLSSKEVSLKGILKDKKVREEDYRKYLEEKYFGKCSKRFNKEEK